MNKIYYLYLYKLFCFGLFKQLIIETLLTQVSDLKSKLQ